MSKSLYRVRLFAYATESKVRGFFCVGLLNWGESWLVMCDTVVAGSREEGLVFFLADCVSSLKAPSEVEIVIADESVAASTVARRVAEGDAEAWGQFGRALEGGGHRLACNIVGDANHLLIQACAATAAAASFIPRERALAALEKSAPPLARIEEAISESGFWPWEVSIIRMRHCFEVVDGRIERFVGDPRSDGMRNLVTPEQLMRITRLGRAVGLRGVSLEMTCHDELGCETKDLNQYAAGWFIEYLTLEALSQRQGPAAQAPDDLGLPADFDDEVMAAVAGEAFAGEEDELWGQPPARPAAPARVERTPPSSSSRAFTTPRDEEGRVIFPRDPLARSMADLVTPKQLGMIRALAREAGVDMDDECRQVMRVRVEELSKRAASSYIDHLKDKGRPAAGGGAAAAAAHPIPDGATPKQLGMIRGLAREAGVDPEEECLTSQRCNTDQLTKRGASTFIDHLKGLRDQAQMHA